MHTLTMVSLRDAALLRLAVVLASVTFLLLYDEYTLKLRFGCELAHRVFQICYSTLRLRTAAGR